jgi:hypothetical protein
MNSPRKTMAPRMPRKRTRCRYWGGDGEVGEEDQPHEDVVHAEGPLDDVPCEELQAFLGPHPEEDQGLEGKGEGDPYCYPRPGLPEAHNVGLPVEDPQVDGQHQGDEEGEAQVMPGGDDGQHPLTP